MKHTPDSSAYKSFKGKPFDRTSQKSSSGHCRIFEKPYKLFFAGFFADFFLKKVRTRPVLGRRKKKELRLFSKRILVRITVREMRTGIVVQPNGSGEGDR